MSSDILAQKRAALKAQQENGGKVAAPAREETNGKMAYTNIVIFTGRLTGEPEYGMTTTGKEYIKCGMAVFNPGSGDKKEDRTMFFDLTMWVKNEADDKGPANVERCNSFLAMPKGKQVRIEGQLTMRTYQEKKYWTIKLEDIYDE